jgi:hypothetical protein
VQSWFKDSSKRLLVPNVEDCVRLAYQLNVWLTLGRDMTPFYWSKDTLKYARSLQKAMAADVARMESPHAVESWNDIIDVLDNMDMRGLVEPSKIQTLADMAQATWSIYGQTTTYTAPTSPIAKFVIMALEAIGERVTPDQVAGTLRRRALPQVAALAKMLASEARSQATNAFLRAVRPNMRRSQVVT